MLTLGKLLCVHRHLCNGKQDEETKQMKHHLRQEKNLLEHHVLLMTWKRLLWGCSGISLVFLCKDGLLIWQTRVQLGWAATSVKRGVQRVTFCAMFPPLRYLFQTFLLGHCIKTAPKHLTIGLIFAENICNGFPYGKKNWYIIRQKTKKTYFWHC